MQHALAFAPPSSPDSDSEQLPFVDYTIPSQWNGLVLVGEAPGADEVRLGRGFVGRSGQLLDKMLQQTGIEREQCIIANVFRYRPPANKIDHFFLSRRAAATANIALDETLGKFGAGLCRSTYAQEIHHLGEMLKARTPRMIMALGRTPLWALTGENGLMEKAGQILPCRLAPKCRVMVTYHPSFILRGNWKLMDQWISHFNDADQYISP